MRPKRASVTAKTKWVTIRLQSTELVNAPGLLRWGQIGWRTCIAQGKETDPFVKAMEAYGLPDDIAKQLLANRIAHRIEGDTVLLDVRLADAKRIRKNG